MKSPRAFRLAIAAGLILPLLLLAAPASGTTFTFDTGLQGWTKLDYFGGDFYWQGSFGNPPGSVRVDDTCAGCGGLVIAAPLCYPVNFTGASPLSYDYYLDPTAVSNFVTFLWGADGTLFRHIDSGPVIGGVWRNHSIPFTEAYWVRVEGGASFATVRSNVVRLGINLDVTTHYGYEGSLDNIVIPGAATPFGAPNNFRATGRIDRIDLSWEFPYSGQSGFEVVRDWSVVYTGSDPNQRTWTDPQAICGPVYDYAVRAIAGGCRGPISAPDSAYMITYSFGAPYGLQASDGLPGRIDVTWGFSSTIQSGFEIKRDGSLVFTGSDPDQRAWTDQQVTCGQVHYYWVRAVANGCRSDFSGPDGGHSGLSGPAPGGVQATDDQCNQITVSWGWSGSGQSGFKIQRGGATVYAGSDPDQRAWTDRQVLYGQDYEYKVAAVSGVCSGQFSAGDFGRTVLLPAELWQFASFLEGWMTTFPPDQGTCVHIPTGGVSNGYLEVHDLCGDCSPLTVVAPLPYPIDLTCHQSVGWWELLPPGAHDGTRLVIVGQDGTTYHYSNLHTLQPGIWVERQASLTSSSGWLPSGGSMPFDLVVRNAVLVGVEMDVSSNGGGNLEAGLDNFELRNSTVSGVHPGDPAPEIGSVRLEVDRPVLSTGQRALIEAWMPVTTEAEVSIFDVTGRHCRRLHQGPLREGAVSFIWDGSNDGGRMASSGIYWIRLISRLGGAAAKIAVIR